jgi:hypothetical protein
MHLRLGFGKKGCEGKIVLTLLVYVIFHRGFKKRFPFTLFRLLRGRDV